MKKEIWKSIDYKTKYTSYEVSNKGRIRSISQNEIRILKPYLTANGYFYIKLSSFHGAVHRLILQAFYGKSDLYTNHKNGIKNDNRLQNLEYVTPSENSKHALKMKLQIPKAEEEHWNSRLTKTDILNIRNSKEKVSVLSKRYKISPGHTRQILHKTRWKNVC